VKKSSSVAAPLLASAALAFLAGCRQHEMQRCVDEHNVVVDDSLCNAQSQRNPNGGFYPNPFRWYYGGWGGFGRGSTAGGGGFTPIMGHSYSSSTTRGGFGSTFHGGEGGASE
jgi:hypothetical protein